MKFVMVVLLSVIATIIYIITMRWLRNIDKIEFNDGVCPYCCGELKCEDIDSTGSRHWICENRYSEKKPCGYECWISYNVDKEKIKNINK